MSDNTPNDDIRRLFPGKVLTDIQIDFARRYHVHGVGMRAVREANYALSTPGAQSAAANRLLKNPKIRSLLSLLKDGQIK